MKLVNSSLFLIAMTSAQQDGATSTESSLFNKEPASNGIGNVIDNSLDNTTALKSDLPNVVTPTPTTTTELTPTPTPTPTTTTELTPTTMQTIPESSNEDEGTTGARNPDRIEDPNAPPGAAGLNTEAPSVGVKVPNANAPTTTLVPVASSTEPLFITTPNGLDENSETVELDGKVPSVILPNASITSAPVVDSDSQIKTGATTPNGLDESSETFELDGKVPSVILPNASITSAPVVDSDSQIKSGATKGQTEVNLDSVVAKIPGFLSNNFHKGSPSNIQQNAGPSNRQQTSFPNQDLKDSVRGIMVNLVDNTGTQLTEKDKKTLRDFVQLVNSNQSELKAKLVIDIASEQLKNKGLASAPACGSGEFAPLNFNLQDNSGVNITQEHAKIFEKVVQSYGIETRGQSEILIQILNTDQRVPENVRVVSRDTCGRPNVVQVHINSRRMQTPLEVLAHINKKMPKILGIDDFVHFKNTKGEPLFKDHANMDLNKLPKVVDAALKYLNCPDMSSHLKKSHLAAVTNYIPNTGFTSVGVLRLQGTGWYQIKDSAVEQAEARDAVMRKTNQGCLYEGIKGL